MSLRKIFYSGLIAVNVVCLAVFLPHHMIGWSLWAAFMIVFCVFSALTDRHT